MNPPIIAGALSLALISTPALADCIAVRDQTPGPNGHGPATVVYVLETGERVASPGPCRVVEAENGARFEADEAGGR